MKHSVLIVDDEKVICNGLERLLKNDYVIHKASNGIEAMDILTIHKDIDVMLCDIKMPEMNGNELIERIRTENNCIYIIVISAATSPAIICDAMKKGANDFIRKPFGINQIEKTIKRAVASRNYSSKDAFMEDSICSAV